MQTLNSSVKSVLTSLENAPQLKNVPTDISNLREEFGQIGSRLTDVEHGIKNMDSLVKTMPEISSKKVAIDDVSAFNYHFWIMHPMHPTKYSWVCYPKEIQYIIFTPSVNVILSILVSQSVSYLLTRIPHSRLWQYFLKEKNHINFFAT